MCYNYSTWKLLACWLYVQSGPIMGVSDRVNILIY